MAISEQNLGRNELDVLWVTIEMWPKFDSFGEEEPSDKKVQCVERGHVG